MIEFEILLFPVFGCYGRPFETKKSRRIQSKINSPFSILLQKDTHHTNWPVFLQHFSQSGSFLILIVLRISFRFAWFTGIGS